MSRKKILWLCSWYPGKTEPFNGDFIQRHARAAALCNDIYVIHVKGDASGKIPTKQEEVDQSPGLTEHIIYYPMTTSFMGRLISHYSWLLIFRRAIRRYIIENGKPDLVHVHIPVKAGMLGLWMKKRYKVPYVLTEHWGIYNDVEVKKYQGQSALFRKYSRKIFSGAAKFISVSKYLAEGVNKLVLNKAYEVVPNAVNTDLFYYKERPASAFRFIHVSNMVPLKNAEGILRTFKKLAERNSHAELIMVGDTDSGIRDYAAKLGLTNQSVHFRGEVPYEQVAKEMQGSDCLILFSNIENSPCVIGEALCCGLPVIATNVGGIPELVNESNGVLIEPGNEEALAAAMLQMMSSYTNYDHKRIAEDAKSKFSYDVIGKTFDAIYNELTAHG